MKKKQKKEAAVTVLINEEGKVLSIARKEPNQHLLGLPGGKLDPGEDSVKAAIRELREETGLEVHSLDYLTRLYEGVDAEGWTVTAYLVYHWTGEPRDVEGQKVRWVDWEELFSPPWEDYNRAVHAALAKDRERVLNILESMVNAAKGCTLGDIVIEMGQDPLPHGGLVDLQDDLIDAGRISAIRYKVPGSKFDLDHWRTFLLPKGSEVLKLIFA